MRQLLLIALCCASVAVADDLATTGNAVGVLAPQDGPGASSCPLMINSDGSYENAVTWKTGGQQPPYYGAFAECYLGPKAVCAFVADLTQIGNYTGQQADFYLWSNVRELNQDTPGGVVYMQPNVNLGAIALWPNISRHVVDLPNPVEMEGRWWTGIWGHWVGASNGWFVAADVDGFGGCPMNNIAPGIGYPSGWQSTSLAFGPMGALGIGVQGQTISTSDVSEAPIRLTSFGKVKALYR